MAETSYALVHSVEPWHKAYWLFVLPKLHSNEPLKQPVPWKQILSRSKVAFKNSRRKRNCIHLFQVLLVQFSSNNLKDRLPDLTFHFSVSLIHLFWCSMGTHTAGWRTWGSLSLSVNPTQVRVSPVRAGNLASGGVKRVLRGRMSFTLQHESFHQAPPRTLTLPSGKADDTNEGWLLVSWHQTHTLLPLCYTVPAAPWESQTLLTAQTHTHTVMAEDRYATTWDRLTAQWQFWMLHGETRGFRKYATLRRLECSR